MKWIAPAVAVIVTLLLASRVADPLELPVRDLAMRLLPSRPATQAVVVVIDEASLQAVGPWPWPRTRLAELVDRIAAGGARGVILDVLLVDALPDDERLAQALRRIPSATVSVLNDRGEWLLPSPPIRAAATPAHGNFELDHDGIVRRFATTKQSRDQSLVALPVEAATIVTGRPVPIGVSIAPAFRTHPRDVPEIRAVDVLRGGGSLRGKLVFVGPIAYGLGDRVLTPVSRRHTPDPGVTVHAAAAESLIRGESIREVPPVLGGILAAVVLWVAGLRGRGVARSNGDVSSPRDLAAPRPWHPILLLFVILLLGETLLATTGFAIPFVTLLGCALFTFLVVNSRRLLASLRSSEASAKRLRRDREAEAESKRVLAHELKTPLASMRGLTQLLGGFELTDAERKRVTSLLEQEAGKLQSMVGGLLDLERLPLRDFEGTASFIQLESLVARRLELLRASADRPLLLSVEEKVMVRGDAVLLERVIDNLVTNALRYAPPPAPIQLRVRKEGSHGILEVEDRGPGVNAEDRERIFQRFFRGAAASSDGGGTQGLGLGLSLVAEVARWHSGSVTVETAADGGALFRFSLPLAERESGGE
jgi:signal transduction histidine kinase